MSKYLMIDRRRTLGNCVLFWAKERRGYTTNIAKAHRFDEDEARDIEGNRSTECAIPYDEVLRDAHLILSRDHIDKRYFEKGFNYFNTNGEPNESEREIEALRRKICRFENFIEDELVYYQYDEGIEGVRRKWEEFTKQEDEFNDID